MATLLSPDDIFIVVMGMTGSGKTKFVEMCTNSPAPAANQLSLQSCTLAVTIHSYNYDNKKIHLIDTPGFNDTYRSDGDILQELAFWLINCYHSSIRLSGVIYIHNITECRIQGSALRSLEIFKNIMGTECYNGVVLATSFWDKVDDFTVARNRQAELQSNPQFWGDLKQGGCKVVALTAGRSSAEDIVNSIARENKRLALRLQCQMALEGLHLHKTDAGGVLYKALYDERNVMKAKLNDLREEMQLAIENRHAHEAEDIRQQMKEFAASIDLQQSKIKALNAPATELTAYFKEKIKAEDEEVKKRLAAIEERRAELALIRSQRTGSDLAVSMPRGAQGHKHELERLEIEHNTINQRKSSSIASRGLETFVGCVAVGAADMVLGGMAGVGCSIM